MHKFFLKISEVYKNNKVVRILVTVASILSIGILPLVVLMLLVFLSPIILIYYVVYFIKTLRYYKTDDFLRIKTRLKNKIDEYNEFDAFMDETRLFIQEQQSLLTQSNVRNSTLTVYKNSQLDIYKYIVKYFFIDTKIDEKTVQIIESILQKYNTISRTYDILQSEYSELMTIVQNDMYYGAYIFKKMTMKRLGSRKLPKFVKDYYLWYSFNYNSPAERKSYRNKIVLDEEKLQEFAQYLNTLIKYRKSIKYQRQLMTPALREKILLRDDYTCKNCSVSRYNEKHLLLEIDHIVPVSKGGITIEDNLQALCWRCNRSKGNKIGDSQYV